MSSLPASNHASDPASILHTLSTYVTPISRHTGQAWVLAGTEATAGWQDGSGGHALFTHPRGLCQSPVTGNLFVIDQDGHVVRTVTQAGHWQGGIAAILVCSAY